MTCTRVSEIDPRESHWIFTPFLANDHFNQKVKFLRQRSLFEIETSQKMQTFRKPGYENEFELHDYSDFPPAKTINLPGDKHRYPLNRIILALFPLACRLEEK